METEIPPAMGAGDSIRFSEIWWAGLTGRFFVNGEDNGEGCSGIYLTFDLDISPMIFYEAVTDG